MHRHSGTCSLHGESMGLEAEISGPEARGRVAIEVRDGGRALTLGLGELWIAPGAPDVRLYLTPRADGEVDASAIELASLSSPIETIAVELVDALPFDPMRAVSVFCRRFSVLFGTGLLRVTEK